MKQVFSPKDIVKSGLCIGCGICVAQSRNSGTWMQFDAFGHMKPRGPADWYTQSSENFSNTCPFSPVAKNEDDLSAALFSTAHQNSEIGRYMSNFVGHVEEDGFRMQGSSGGLVTWVASELIKKGMIDGVAHVVATEDPENTRVYFRYRISRTEHEIRQGAKSRYYPVELSDILKTIMDVPGRYAIIAIPCMIKAVQLLRRENPIFRERILFTLGLFCGHMKSARFVESFAWQMKVPVKEIKQVEFRYKHPERPANWYNAALTLNNGQTINKDWWHLADGDWGAGFFMNPACNFCDDVVAETADISFGDAWLEPYASDGKGTNVVVVRSPLMNSIIQEGRNSGRLTLKEVDSEFVAQTQAAGLRQRREGLAYRLTWAPYNLQPVKRVPPNAEKPTKMRKVIYRLRYLISKWSHRMFWLSRKMEKPMLYLFWARSVAAIYHGIAYHKGKPAEIKKRFVELGR